METLLTPSESLAFQSFLSAVDGSQPTSDWAAYSSQFNTHTIPRDEHHLVLDPLPLAPENDSLTKATKDLMSLDAPGWSNGSLTDSLRRQQHLMYDHQMLQQQTQPLSPNRHMYSSAHEPFPFLNPKGSFQSTPSFQTQQHQQYTHPLQSLHALPSSSSATPPDLFSLPRHLPQEQQELNSRSSSHTHVQGPNSQRASSASGSKRPARSTNARASSSSNASKQRGPSQTQKRQAKSPADSLHLDDTSQGNAKPALLSPLQKKANHIQSEQKRRANIRRGYEALCDTVPALREAIREEEEEMRQAAANAGTANGGSKGKAAGKKRMTKKDDQVGAKDRIDGRAGPRSENVVLSKTIDYISDLLSEKSNLLARLHKARLLLPPGHPGLTALSPEPAWEREWKGGEGKFLDEDEEGEESEGGGGAEAEEVSRAGGARSRQKRSGDKKP